MRNKAEKLTPDDEGAPAPPDAGIGNEPAPPATPENATTGGNSTGKITFGTEGGLFQQALGTPAVVCGPGNIAVAHKPDEHVSEAQLALCDLMLERLVEKLSVTGSGG